MLGSDAQPKDARAKWAGVYEMGSNNDPTLQEFDSIIIYLLLSE